MRDAKNWNFIKGQQGICRNRGKVGGKGLGTGKRTKSRIATGPPSPTEEVKCEDTVVPIEKKKKKKGLKEKIKEKLSGEKEEEVKCEDTVVPIEKCDDADEKKGFLEKIKEKLPGGKKTEEVAAPPPAPAAEECPAAPEVEGKEKKSFLEKIKEKLPGHHHSKSEEEKEKETEKEKEECH